jgi:hypothetical protein
MPEKFFGPLNDGKALKGGASSKRRFLESVMPAVLEPAAHGLPIIADELQVKPGIIARDGITSATATVTITTSDNSGHVSELRVITKHRYGGSSVRKLNPPSSFTEENVAGRAGSMRRIEAGIRVTEQLR